MEEPEKQAIPGRNRPERTKLRKVVLDFGEGTRAIAVATGDQTEMDGLAAQKL
jgi:hypothetical protein